MTSATAMSAEGSLPSGETKPPSKGLMLGDALRGHSNSLGFIRLVLAGIVILDHAFPLGGFGTDPTWTYTKGQASLGSIAVGGFFAISGYLIVKSGMSADIVQFLWRRFLRIFPAFWAVLLVTALLIAPIIWVADGHNLVQYFGLHGRGPLNYFTANWNLNIGSYGIYDLLANTTPYGRSLGGSYLNGSLWTLTYEWLCYLLVGVLLVFGFLRRAKIVVPLLTGFMVAAAIVEQVAPKQVGKIAFFLWDPEFIFLVMIFAFGACLALYSKSVPFDNRLGIFSGLVFIVTIHYGAWAIIGTAAGAYFVLYLAARLPSLFRRVGAKNDYSYGVYIYGFLVQQILAYLGVYKWGYLPYVFVAIVVTFAFAWLSWHGVEKHAMALKDWGPGHGWRYWLSRWSSWRAARRVPDARLATTKE